jgi:hypothetical protein
VSFILIIFPVRKQFPHLLSLFKNNTPIVWVLFGKVIKHDKKTLNRKIELWFLNILLLTFHNTYDVISESM